MEVHWRTAIIQSCDDFLLAELKGFLIGWVVIEEGENLSFSCWGTVKQVERSNMYMSCHLSGVPSSIFLKIYLFFSFIFISWRLITLQYYSVFFIH